MSGLGLGQLAAHGFAKLTGAQRAAGATSPVAATASGSVVLPDGTEMMWSASGNIGATGATGRGISTVVRTSGTGAPGTTDTYTITYSDATTSTFGVYNGADGSGPGDMLRSAYDTNADGKVNAADAADAVPWSGVTGKPSTFAPSTHAHAITDVTGLQTALDAAGSMSAADKAKLDGIAAGATAYTHPASHPASIITQDANNRFVTDANKAAWDAKQAALVSGANIKTVGGVSLLGSGDVAVGGGVDSYAYDARASLRSLSPADGDAAVVVGLGLFVWAAGSTEPDDDESCFATASGRWLLEAASWDLVDAWMSPDQQALTDDDEDEPERFAASFASKVITNTFTNTVSSLSANTTTTLTVSVPGALAGASVLVTRSGPSADKPDGIVYGAVLTNGTATVYLAAGNLTSYFLTSGAWRVTAINH